MNYGKLNPQTLKDFGNKKWSGKLNGFILTQLKYLTKKGRGTQSELLDDDLKNNCLFFLLKISRYNGTNSCF
jgi:hypothetical protein